ncbi:MAG: hypothetical protein ABI836_10440 [Gemmatimonadota bacterium]
MEESKYLHFRIQGRGRLTLSIPDGVGRALQSGRLPLTADVWLDALGVWIPMARHPEVARCQAAPPLVIERFSADHLVIREPEEVGETSEELLVSRVAEAEWFETL